MKAEVKAESKVGERVEALGEGNFRTTMPPMEKHKLKARAGAKVEDLAEAKGGGAVMEEVMHLVHGPDGVTHRL